MSDDPIAEAERRSRTAAIDRDRYDFLRTDLALCFTFIELVRTELRFGHLDIAERVFRKVELAYETIAHHLAYVKDPEQYEKIAQGLSEVREALNSLQPK